ncbi:hypothetical protein BDN72DRAFT_797050 [Pluteus cervinus]|uniref:Uncharacterized protein n=1 Tax=Pluteus cervinus TaxID=181527 RepID=A0ACD3AVH4_9AGAR|nr:hypothetical protein BDN72DRAFT_797050 [Pluteus cervinus]
MNLVTLPLEIVETIILASDPIEVAQLSQTCRCLYSSVYPSSPESVLWRSLFLQQPLDDPRQCVSNIGFPRKDIDWCRELQRIVRARTVLQDPSLLRPNEVVDILRTLVQLVSNVPPMFNLGDDDDPSFNLAWTAAYLRKCSFLDRDFPVDPKYSEELAQLLAYLHTLYGITRADTKPSRHVESRAYVYNLRNYRWDNEFGPFDEQGGVNWVHMQALHHVVSMHVVDVKEELEHDRIWKYQMSIPHTQIVIPRGLDLDETKDWAGVTGVWLVSFCFCDHRVLLAFNESGGGSESEPLDTSTFERPDFVEVFRTLEIHIRVTRTLYDQRHPNRPTIYFVGAMGDPSTSTINGRVQMTPDNQVQWHFVSGEQGNAIWSSEGVQVGGIRSRFGVLGSWTTIFHDPDDPVGPFWLRKVSELEESGSGLDNPLL